MREKGRGVGEGRGSIQRCKCMQPEFTLHEYVRIRIFTTGTVENFYAKKSVENTSVSEAESFIIRSTPAVILTIHSKTFVVNGIKYS